MTGVAAVAGTNGTQFDVTFPAQAATGTYTLVVGPDVRDLAGNPMDQNRNGRPGEAGDRYTATTTCRRAEDLRLDGRRQGDPGPGHGRLAADRSPTT